MSPSITREAWLHSLAGLLRAHFELAGYPLPPDIYLSIGWPAQMARSRKKRAVGECWGPANSTDGSPHIFISPLLQDPFEVAVTLVHELLHAALPPGVGHGSAFVIAMKRVGLVDKVRATKAGPELKVILNILIDTLPEFPHVELPEPEKKTQTTRMILVGVDHGACSYRVRLTRKYLSQGPPLCPHGHPMKEIPHETRD